jgi:tripartite-type tricarboxylate transporter receptor subunit TctC
MKMITLAVSLLLLIESPAVHAQAPYYQGKTITFVTGSPAGDLFDLYVRTVGQFLVKHIPGNPDLIVQNMPGAGHIIAANYVYNIAKPDGLTLAGTLATLYIDQLVGQPEVKYDWAKFTWIGNAGKSPMLLYMRTDSPYRPSMTFVTQRNLPSAVPRVCLIPAMSCPNSSRKQLVQNSMLYSATRAAAPSTWRWKEVRWCAALSA